MDQDSTMTRDYFVPQVLKALEKDGKLYCFFHELEYLASMGLVKGGDVDNAIVIVEHPVSEEQIHNMCTEILERAHSAAAKAYNAVYRARK